MSNLTISRDLSVWQPKKQGAIPIQESDWERLKRMIQAIIPHKRVFQILASVCLGIFGSSIFGLLGFAASQTVPSWIWQITWIVFWVSLIVGGALLFLDFLQNNMITASTKQVLGEMEAIEQCFEKLDAAQP
jgi:hypothetical protein